MAIEGTLLYNSIITRLAAHPDLDSIIAQLNRQHDHDPNTVDTGALNVNDGLIWRDTLMGSNYWEPVQRAWRSGGYLKKKEYAAIYD